MYHFSAINTKRIISSTPINIISFTLVGTKEIRSIFVCTCFSSAPIFHSPLAIVLSSFSLLSSNSPFYPNLILFCRIISGFFGMVPIIVLYIHENIHHYKIYINEPYFYIIIINTKLLYLLNVEYFHFGNVYFINYYSIFGFI